MNDNTNVNEALPAMLKPAQAAKVLSCSARTVTRMCELGKIRAVRIGCGSKTSWRINRDHLYEFAGIVKEG